MKRSKPFFESLVRIKNVKEKIKALNHFPDYVVQDIIEVLYNVANQNCKINKCQREKLVKEQRNIEKILKAVAKNKKKKAKHILKGQKGGFIATLIPIVLSVLNSIL